MSAHAPLGRRVWPRRLLERAVVATVATASAATAVLVTTAPVATAATRYWVCADNGTWGSTAGTLWSTSDGGAGGVSVPVVNDTVNLTQAKNVNLGVSYTSTGLLALNIGTTLAGTELTQPNFTMTVQALTVGDANRTGAYVLTNTGGTPTLNVTNNEIIGNGGLGAFTQSAGTHTAAGLQIASGGNDGVGTGALR